MTRIRTLVFLRESLKLIETIVVVQPEIIMSLFPLCGLRIHNYTSIIYCKRLRDFLTKLCDFKVILTLVKLEEFLHF